MNSLITATLQSCFSLPLFLVGTNVKSSAETSQGTAAFWAIRCSAPAPTGTWIFSLTNDFLPLFLSIFLIHLFSSLVLIFLALQICCLCPLKEWFIHSRACSLLKSTACSSGWISLASECPWFTLGVQGAHDWVHYKLVTMSLMAQMPWEYFRSWAPCLCRKSNAFITLTTGLWLWMGDAEPERAACLKLHSMCQKKNRILAVSGKEGDPGSPRQNWSSDSDAGREIGPQNWGQHMILPWIPKSIIQERRWQCAFLCPGPPPGAHGGQVTVQLQLCWLSCLCKYLTHT